MVIDIRSLEQLTFLRVEHHYSNSSPSTMAQAGLNWTRQAGDPSGPPLRNLITILTHCPGTLTSIIWLMGFNFLHAVGDDLQREIVKEYHDLNRVLNTRFLHLELFTIVFQLPEEYDSLEDGCKNRLKGVFGGLEEKLYLRRCGQ